MIVIEPEEDAEIEALLDADAYREHLRSRKE